MQNFKRIFILSVLTIILAPVLTAQVMIESFDDITNFVTGPARVWNIAAQDWQPPVDGDTAVAGYWVQSSNAVTGSALSVDFTVGDNDEHVEIKTSIPTNFNFSNATGFSIKIKSDSNFNNIAFRVAFYETDGDVWYCESVNLLTNTTWTTYTFPLDPVSWSVSPWGGGGDGCFDYRLLTTINIHFLKRFGAQHDGVVTLDDFQFETNGPPFPNQVTGITNGTVTDNSIDLSWDAQTGVDGYYVYFSDNAVKPGLPTVTVSSNVTNYSFTSLDPGKGYYFWITAFSSSGTPCEDTGSLLVYTTGTYDPYLIESFENPANFSFNPGARWIFHQTGNNMDGDWAPPSGNTGIDSFSNQSADAISGNALQVTYSLGNINEDASFDAININVDATFAQAVSLMVKGNGNPGQSLWFFWRDSDGDQWLSLNAAALSGTNWQEVLVPLSSSAFTYPGWLSGPSGDGVFDISDMKDIEIHIQSTLDSNEMTNIVCYIDELKLVPVSLPWVTGIVVPTNSTNTALVNWLDNSTNETGFKIYWNVTNVITGAPSVTVAADTTNAVISNLTAGTTYYVWVRSLLGATESIDSTPASFTTLGTVPGVPPAPTDLSISRDLNFYTNHLSWTDNALFEEGFIIYRADYDYAPTTLIDIIWARVIGVVGSNVTEFTDTGCLPGRSYTYYVTSFLGAAQSTHTVAAVKMGIDTDDGLAEVDMEFGLDVFKAAPAILDNDDRSAEIVGIPADVSSVQIFDMSGYRAFDIEMNEGNDEYEVVRYTYQGKDYYRFVWKPWGLAKGSYVIKAGHKYIYVVNHKDDSE